MATYVIGDLHGCYDELLQLLNLIQYNDNRDSLLFTGDLVNGGTQSKACLELLIDLSKIPGNNTALGNHDLALLGAALQYYPFPSNRDIGVDDILLSTKLPEYIEWLISRPLLIDLPEFKATVVHAGLHPHWSLTAAKQYAAEALRLLRNPKTAQYIFPRLHENQPLSMTGLVNETDKVLYTLNVLTKIRYCKVGVGADTAADLSLDLNYKQDPSFNPPNLVPWFSLVEYDTWNRSIVFGHWASLINGDFLPVALCVDKGCVWGRELAAVRLDDFKVFSVPATQITSKT